MALEPWCAMPWDVARLTDHQIIYRYYLPKKKQDEAAERYRKGLPAEQEGWEEPPEGAVPPREMLIGWFMQLGMSQEQAVAEYETQKRMNEENR